MVDPLARVAHGLRDPFSVVFEAVIAAAVVRASGASSCDAHACENRSLRPCQRDLFPLDAAVFADSALYCAGDADASKPAPSVARPCLRQRTNEARPNARCWDLHLRSPLESQNWSTLVSRPRPGMAAFKRRPGMDFPLLGRAARRGGEPGGRAAAGRGGAIGRRTASFDLWRERMGA
jgi:hypothetical protein